MTYGPLTYTWNGLPMLVDPYEGPMDVTAIYPDHPTGEVAEGETDYLCWFVFQDQNNGFWLSESAFQDHAEPAGPGAMEREGVADD